jgi:hypothetical protein
MPCGFAPDRWGEDLGAPRSYFVARLIRAGFEPRRADGIAHCVFQIHTLGSRQYWDDGGPTTRLKSGAGLTL